MKQTILTELNTAEFRDAYGSFRLPIDQVFSVQGQGTVVRGTVYEGVVRKAAQLLILPGEIPVKARQIQVHHEEREQARAGQRTAINLGGIDRTAVKRGDVLVDSENFLVTDTLDVALQVIGRKFTPLKQRTAVKVHIGTSEVMGKIVFFDRKELEQTPDEVLCQIRLDEKIVVRRGDRFILRRPSPMETIGGGWVIQPTGGKYRFGTETIEMLRQYQQGTPQDLVADALNKYQLLDEQQLMQQTSLDAGILKTVLGEGVASGLWMEIPRQGYSLSKTFIKIKDEFLERLREFHEEFPMRTGMGKAEMIQSASGAYPKPLLEYSLNLLGEQQEIKRTGQFVAIAHFQPHLPKKWRARMEQVIVALEKDGFQVKKWEEYFLGSPLPKMEIAELTVYLLETSQAYRLKEDTLIHRTAFQEAFQLLKNNTGSSFDLKQAKDILNLSRKYMIPFLELLDEQNYTRRAEDQRYWMEEK